MTVDIPDTLLCLFSAHVERRDGRYVIEIPERELDQGALAEQDAYRIGLFPTDRPAAADQQTAQPSAGPPVEEGDKRTVEIESLGEEGDGVARVDRGFIVFVPGTEVGDTVDIEITTVKDQFAVGEPIENPAEETAASGLDVDPDEHW